ncbi:ribose-phosphate pyrophosphokinase [Candidatus Pacebacteria bacterium]|nr:ribose-phosphate pyrophosphokinase [Candidatus Paceibacterota bacterium]
MKHTKTKNGTHTHSDNNCITLFTGNANPKLAKEIAAKLDTPLSNMTIDRFNDGEIQCEIHDNVRDSDAYIIQSTCPPVNENIMELVVMADALKRASVRRVTAVIPYYGYARQDRKDKLRVPVTARLIADMLEASGIDRVIAVHLHSAQVQGFFDIPLDHLYTSHVLLEKVNTDSKNLTVVSPDAGSVKGSRHIAEKLGVPLAIVDKRRGKPGDAEAMTIIGTVDGADCLIFDDMVDTGGTLIAAAGVLKDAGAKSICVCASHPVFSKNAIERLEASPIDSIVVSDSIPHPDSMTKSGKFTVVSLAPLLSEAIRNVHEGNSISALFD